jgi:hypothetical protein
MITPVSFHGGHKRQHGMPKTEVVLLSCEIKHGKADTQTGERSEGNGSTHAATLQTTTTPSKKGKRHRVWHYYYGDVSRTLFLDLPSWATAPSIL